MVRTFHNSVLFYFRNRKDNTELGYGKYYLKDGSMFEEGFFKGNKINGYGKIYWNNGEIVKDNITILMER
jgi:antitoxin component YwqK of YwqJK toxin-antitoxin module